MKHKIINHLSLHIPKYVSDISRAAGLRPSSVRRALKAMIAEGVVVRFRSCWGGPYQYLLDGNCRFSTLQLRGYNVKLASILLATPL
jgi:DNA-binding transcriptional ArsR family regulator